MNKDPKQVIIIRKDLKMRRGKEIAQGSHASLGALLSISSKKDGKIIIDTTKDIYLKQWLEQRFTKITVQCPGEKELVEIYNQAKKAGLPCVLITDAGLTEFNGVPTKTCVGIGPADPDEIDKITGNLPLY